MPEEDLFEFEKRMRLSLSGLRLIGQLMFSKSEYEQVSSAIREKLKVTDETLQERLQGIPDVVLLFMMIFCASTNMILRKVSGQLFLGA